MWFTGFRFGLGAGWSGNLFVSPFFPPPVPRPSASVCMCVCLYMRVHARARCHLDRLSAEACVPLSLCDEPRASQQHQPTELVSRGRQGGVGRLARLGRADEPQAACRSAKPGMGRAYSGWQVQGC